MTQASTETSSNSTATLSALAHEYWEKRLENEPIEATFLGDRRHDDRLADVSEAAHQREIARLEALQKRVRALDPAALPEPERITLDALTGEIENDLALRACHLDAWAVDPRNGPQVVLLSLAQLQTVSTPEQARALVLRWQKMGAYIDGQTENLRRSLAEGKVATREAVLRVRKQLDDMLAKPDTEWVLMSPRNAPPPSLSEGEKSAFAEGVAKAVSEVIRPAFQRYRDAIASEILPRARDDRHVGLSHIAGGAECYARLIKVHTSLALSAEEIHAFGLEEIARIREEMKALGEKALGTRDLAAIQRRLRSDPALFFTSREEVEAKAAQALARAEAAFPGWFGRVPRTGCVVKRIEAYEEQDSTIGYYRQPAMDGSRPGTYYINTYAPETRPRYEAEVLAFHEAVPGHHSQVAIAQELGNVPEFRKHAGVTAYVEGWALYTERLAAEMGLYSGDLDRMGMLSFDAWRASRLVVDTGMHVKGWSRQEAVAYMLENTVLAENNIVNEVDRYVNWPGQALAYKIGQREILKLRAEAEERLGARFDIKGFHDTVLGSGAVSLAMLRELVEQWVEGKVRAGGR